MASTEGIHAKGADLDLGGSNLHEAVVLVSVEVKVVICHWKVCHDGCCWVMLLKIPDFIAGGRSKTLWSAEKDVCDSFLSAVRRQDLDRGAERQV